MSALKNAWEQLLDQRWLLPVLQIEYVLRDALRKAGRLPKGGAHDTDKKESP